MPAMFLACATHIGILSYTAAMNKVLEEVYEMSQDKYLVWNGDKANKKEGYWG